MFGMNQGLMMLIIFGSALLPIILVVVIVGGLMKSQAKTDQLLTTGMPARGRILGIAHTGGSVAVMGHRHLRLHITAEVRPQAGMPYTTTFEQLISELQIPSVQPGVEVELRIDPQNPNRVALAATGVAQAPMGGGGFGGGYGAQPAPMMIQNVGQPNYKSAFPRMAIIMFVTTVPVTVILAYTFIDFRSLFGSSSSSSSDESASSDDDAPKKKKKKTGVCEEAAGCCRALAGDNKEAAKNCDNYGLMPVEGCRQTVQAMKPQVEKMGKSCE